MIVIKHNRLIELTDINCMARIMNIPIADHSGISVYLYSNEGDHVPHFHVREHPNSGWNVPVKLFYAEYFHHGVYKDSFPKGISKKLDSALRMHTPDGSGNTYWQTIVNLWKTYVNDKKEIEKYADIVTQPDYRKL